ncbi:hypothetical protein SEEE3402_18335 [Salmonella enterica subsp. enterica serovar Enteritidis str. 3402]|nr:hypothetical protein SEEG0564_15955 [Salmonella enterica subsp. enterica serovar Give str. 564]ETC67565.1 hypothetical protein SEEE3402_18335 [Salmonella enterica subsp. enterica serovar Enteritidis str. 3402]
MAPPRKNMKTKNARGASLTGAIYRRADKHSAIRQNNWEFIQNYW